MNDFLPNVTLRYYLYRVTPYSKISVCAKLFRIFFNVASKISYTVYAEMAKITATIKEI